ncbi:MAG: CoA-transferase [Acidobacteria bacterium RIFCSPLOWO2_12_FULL_67_14b]|nr:MAG: CoA-transferase [Acidobacteria bacterium RIFCSPLOWO2_12_FULL_67_14b]
MSQARLLDGIVVLDATQVMAGPYCAMLLADMGARVIKVEPPAGDSTRSMAGARGGDSPAFNAVNRGKLGIVLDLTKPQAIETFTRLARTADILVENYRPGVMARLGLDYAALSSENPRLIYASISGYGQTGPWASKGGFDLIAQGVSGIMSVTGAPGGPPVKAGVPLTDLGAGLFAAIGILAALHHRSVSGRGQHVDTSLADAGLALSVWEATDYFTSGEVPGPLGSAHRMTAPYQAFRCADGYITIGAANDRNFARLADLLGHREWTSDARFVADHARVQHRAELAAAIEAVMFTETRATWLERLDAAGIPCGPILDYQDALTTPQAIAREMTVDVDHPTLGPLRTLGTPIKMSGTPLNPRRRGPMLGEHTDEVLSSAGFSDNEIDQLRSAGAVR